MLKLVILLVLLTACNTELPSQAITEADYPRYDAVVNGYEGVAVFPEEQVYKFNFEGQGDLDAFSVTSCHRETWKWKAWNVTQNIRYGVFGWGKRTIDKKREIVFDYKPAYIEGDGNCMLVMQGFEVAGNHSFFAADFENRKFQLGAYEQCDGITKKVNGTSLCQAKIGNYQGISFDEKVKVSGKNKCGIIVGDSKNIEYSPLGGFCTVVFEGIETKKLHKLTIYGYNKTQIRKQ